MFVILVGVCFVWVWVLNLSWLVVIMSYWLLGKVMVLMVCNRDSKILLSKMVLLSSHEIGVFLGRASRLHLLIVASDRHGSSRRAPIV